VKNTFRNEQDKLWELGVNVSNCRSVPHFDSLIQEINQVAVQWVSMNEKHQLTDEETEFLVDEARDLRDLILHAKARRMQ